MTARPTDIDQARFLADVAQHQITIVHDDPAAALRVIRFARPGSSIMAFTLTTWPGYLAFSGDMGTYVFARLRDMFEFFRPPVPKDGAARALEINPGYWSEKVEAACRDGVKEFSFDVFRRRVGEWLDDRDASAETRAAVDEALAGDLSDRGADAASEWACDFRDAAGRRVFQDFWEVDCTEYTFRFIWCCFALVWGIDQYDRATAPAALPEGRSDAELEADHG